MGKARWGTVSRFFGWLQLQTKSGHVPAKGAVVAELFRLISCSFHFSFDLLATSFYRLISCSFHFSFDLLATSFYLFAHSRALGLLLFSPPKSGCPPCFFAGSRKTPFSRPLPLLGTAAVTWSLICHLL